MLGEMMPRVSFKRISILDSAAAAARPEKRDRPRAPAVAAAECKNWRREFMGISVSYRQILPQTAISTRKNLVPRGMLIHHHVACTRSSSPCAANAYSARRLYSSTLLLFYFSTLSLLHSFLLYPPASQSHSHYFHESLFLRALVGYHFGPNWFCPFRRKSGGSYAGTHNQ